MGVCGFLQCSMMAPSFWSLVWLNPDAWHFNWSKFEWLLFVLQRLRRISSVVERPLLTTRGSTRLGALGWGNTSQDSPCLLLLRVTWTTTMNTWFQSPLSQLSLQLYAVRSIPMRQSCCGPSFLTPHYTLRTAKLSPLSKNTCHYYKCQNFPILAEEEALTIS